MDIPTVSAQKGAVDQRLRIPKELHKKIAASARQNGVPMNTMMCSVLAHYYGFEQTVTTPDQKPRR